MEPEYEKVDIEEAVERLHLSQDFIERMINKFLYSDMLDKADESFKAGDVEGSKIAIHTIKGAAANIGLSGISKLALDIETKIKENGYLDMEMLANMRRIWEELQLKYKPRV